MPLGSARAWTILVGTVISAATLPEMETVATTRSNPA